MFYMRLHNVSTIVGGAGTLLIDDAHQLMRYYKNICIYQDL